MEIWAAWKQFGIHLTRSLQPEFQSIFRWSNETNQESHKLTVPVPTSLRYRVQNDSYFKNLFNFDIPVLMWDSHFTEGAKENMSMRPPPYGWKNLPTEEALFKGLYSEGGTPVLDGVPEQDLWKT
ncbi:unnamed protein product [Ranitomeya imitator]|uniref:Uncharacterized protein n=1 Tax=Ranitomeya imitator TaxID=111125 RepID=A0ABN9LHR9_9NEOB|nr:unnamed protein product [Ranitomeya imitator]